jgi:hypothetical protein
MADVRGVTGPWEELLVDCVNRSRDVIRIASPFIKADAAKKLVAAKPSKVQLKYMNAFKLQYFYSGASDLSALTAILDAGGAVRNLQRLHSKMYIFDDSKAIITSANLTRGGLNNNFEYGVLIEQPAFLHTVIADFESLFGSEEATGSITDAEIRKASAIVAAAPKRMVVDFSRIAEGLEGDNDEFVGGELSIERNLAGWKLDVFRCLRQIDSSTFDLSDVYKFESILRHNHPANRHISDKIRQQLQYLRDLGLIEFRGPGVYRKLWQEADRVASTETY